MVFHGEALMVVDLPARRSEITVLPNYLWRAHGSMVPIVVEFALDLDDHQVVHATGLSLPKKEGMVLISAPSGTGKTTTALALARCGLRLAIEPMNSSEMLAALAADNVRGLKSGPTLLQKRRFAMLADLVQTVPAYSVTITEGLSDIEAIADWLGSA